MAADDDSSTEELAWLDEKAEREEKSFFDMLYPHLNRELTAQQRSAVVGLFTQSLYAFAACDNDATRLEGLRARWRETYPRLAPTVRRVIKAQAKVLEALDTLEAAGSGITDDDTKRREQVQGQILKRCSEARLLITNFTLSVPKRKIEDPEPREHAALRKQFRLQFAALLQDGLGWSETDSDLQIARIEKAFWGGSVNIEETDQVPAYQRQRSREAAKRRAKSRQ